MKVGKSQRLLAIIGVGIILTSAAILFSYGEVLIGGKHLSALVAEMNDDDPEIAGNAEELLRAAGPRAIPPLISVLRHRNASHRDVYNSIRAKLPEFLQRLAPRMEDKDLCRLKAANVLASFGLVAEPAVAPLTELLHDQNAALRLAAVRALGSIGPAARETIPDLLSLRESSDVTTRVLAAWALWKIDPETQEAVAAQMSVEAIGKGYYVTQSAISWLTEMGKEDLVMPALIKALKPENPLKRRVEVVMLIGTMGPKAKVAVQPLTEALFDASVGLRQCAAQTLGEIGPEARSALPALYKAVKQYPESAQVFGNAIRRIERREPLKLSGR